MKRFDDCTNVKPGDLLFFVGPPPPGASIFRRRRADAGPYYPVMFYSVNEEDQQPNWSYGHAAYIQQREDEILPVIFLSTWSPYVVLILLPTGVRGYIESIHLFSSD